jgi:hypothetical protein
MKIEALLTVTKGKPTWQLIRDLKHDSSILLELNRSFIRASEGTRIVSAFETRETPTVEYDVRDVNVKHTDTSQCVIVALTDAKWHRRFTTD